jgi:hypothetical protein
VVAVAAVAVEAAAVKWQRQGRRKSGGGSSGSEYNQPTETKYEWGEKNRCKIMNGGQESRFDDILMNGHTQKT